MVAPVAEIRSRTLSFVLFRAGARQLDDDVDYFQPWQRRVPIIVRPPTASSLAHSATALPSHKKLPPAVVAAANTATAAAVAAVKAAPKKRLHAESQEWVSRYVLTADGSLTAAVVRTLTEFFAGFVSGASATTAATAASASKPLVLRASGIRLLAARLRRIVLEYATQQVLAEGTSESAQLDNLVARSNSTPGATQCKRGSRAATIAAVSWCRLCVRA